MGNKYRVINPKEQANLGEFETLEEAEAFCRSQNERPLSVVRLPLSSYPDRLDTVSVFLSEKKEDTGNQK